MLPNGISPRLAWKVKDQDPDLPSNHCVTLTPVRPFNHQEEPQDALKPCIGGGRLAMFLDIKILERGKTSNQHKVVLLLCASNLMEGGMCWKHLNSPCIQNLWRRRRCVISVGLVASETQRGTGKS